MHQPQAGSDVWMLQTARARQTFPTDVGRTSVERMELRMAVKTKKREEGEIKKRINKTQVERGNFNFKGNKYYER